MKRMLSFLLLAGLIFLASCEEQEAVGGKMSDAERQAVTQATQDRCFADSDKTWNDFVAYSNQEMMSMLREEAWKYEMKKDSTATSDAADKLIVWKVVPATNSAYFVLKQSVNGVLKYKFYKVTTSINSEMYKDLQLKKCTKVTNVKVTSSASSATLTRDYDATINSDNTKTDRELVYNYKSLMPALFGYIANKSVIKTLNSKDVVTATQTYTATLTEIAKVDIPETLPTDGDNTFCIIKFNAAPGSGDANLNRVTYNVPYTEECTDNASTTLTAGNGVTFLPATELALP